MLCPWSNLLSCVNSLVTVGGPMVVVTKIWSHTHTHPFGGGHGLVQWKVFPALALLLCLGRVGF